jgi:hypothetical protein
MCTSLLEQVLYKRTVRVGGYPTLWNLKFDAVLLIGFKMVSMFCVFNTLWTGDADLRLYITTVQDG